MAIICQMRVGFIKNDFKAALLTPPSHVVMATVIVSFQNNESAGKLTYKTNFEEAGWPSG